VHQYVLLTYLFFDGYRYKYLKPAQRSSYLNDLFAIQFSKSSNKSENLFPVD